MLAAALHELGHLAALKVFGYPVRAICLGSGGAVIETDAMRLRHECVCALSGPLISFIIFLFIGKFPLLGFFGLVQLFFNMIPIWPSDGGRIVKCVLLKYCPCQIAAVLMKLLECICYIGLLVIGAYITIQLSFGVVPLLIPIIYYFRQRKPCKESSL